SCFFVQAEDGIRDFHVTGVQTCALPISLHKAGRPILFSICEWGDNKPWDWAKDIGHAWRTTGDIYPCWDCELNHGSWSSWGVLPILDKQDKLRKYSGPGHWNDMDMMEVGNGMTEAQVRSHFSLWAI